MAITIKDIANRAGISAASVSRILTNRGRFSAETAQRVRQLAEEMGYYKNQSAGKSRDWRTCPCNTYQLC